MTTFIVFLVSLFGFMSLGLPLAFVLVICALLMMLSLGQSDIMVVAQNMVSGTNSFSLMAIPFFMLAGEIMDRGGLSIRIVRFAKLIVGRVRGGLGYVAILSTIVFSGLSGSAVADAAALGAILIPLMVKNGYRKSRSVAFIAAGAIVAPMIQYSHDSDGHFYGAFHNQTVYVRPGSRPYRLPGIAGSLVFCPAP